MCFDSAANIDAEAHLFCALQLEIADLQPNSESANSDTVMTAIKKNNPL
jgi:hypothetical protein